MKEQGERIEKWELEWQRSRAYYPTLCQSSQPGLPPREGENRKAHQRNYQATIKPKARPDRVFSAPSSAGQGHGDLAGQGELTAGAEAASRKKRPGAVTAGKWASQL